LLLWHTGTLKSPRTGLLRAARAMPAEGRQPGPTAGRSPRSVIAAFAQVLLLCHLLRPRAPLPCCRCSVCRIGILQRVRAFQTSATDICIVSSPQPLSSVSSRPLSTVSSPRPLSSSGVNPWVPIRSHGLAAARHPGRRGSRTPCRWFVCTAACWISVGSREGQPEKRIATRMALPNRKGVRSSPLQMTNDRVNTRKPLVNLKRSPGFRFSLMMAASPL
jgi:hypothetical protein